MKFYYMHIFYDGKRDDFFALVDDGHKNSKSVFQIDDTKEMCDLIKTGRMKHIDDVEGLTAFLKEQDIIRPEDTVFLDEEVSR